MWTLVWMAVLLVVFVPLALRGLPPPRLTDPTRRSGAPNGIPGRPTAGDFVVVPSLPAGPQRSVHRGRYVRDCRPGPSLSVVRR